MSVPILAWLMAGLAPAAVPFVGMYDGGRMEMAAGLELKADGRFRYGLSYGALDEAAEGSWTVEQDHVLLTSDPFEQARFELIEQGAAPPGKIRLRLEAPEGLPLQLFAAELEGGGDADVHQLEAAEEEFDHAARTLRLALPMFEIRSEPIDLAKGAAVRVKFDPRNLGKVAFDRTRLIKEEDGLLLERFGEAIRFRRVADASGQAESN